MNKNRTNRTINHILWFLCLFILLIFMVVSILGISIVQATTLNLTLSDSPDIKSGLIQVEYFPTIDIFSASGIALSIDDDGADDSLDIIGGMFSISANIDETGFASSGGLSIEGIVPDLGFTSGTLLTGELTDFGYPDGGGDPFELLFNVTGGDAAHLYGPVAGVILDNTGFGGSFDDFFNSFLGVSVTGTPEPISTVPEPATLTLILLGGIGLWITPKDIKPRKCI